MCSQDTSQEKGLGWVIPIWIALIAGFLAASLVGCSEDTTNTSSYSKTAGVVESVKYFGDDYLRVAVKFNDGRAVAFRMLPREINSGQIEIEPGKHHTFYFDSWGDLQKVEKEGDGDEKES